MKEPGQSFTAGTSLPCMAPFESSAFAALTRAGENCGKACRAWQQEVLRFTSARFKKDVELGRQLLACGNWSEASKLQQEWVASTAQDYIDEASALARLASEAGVEFGPAPSGEARPMPRHHRQHVPG